MSIFRLCAILLFASLLFGCGGEYRSQAEQDASFDNLLAGSYRAGKITRETYLGNLRDPSASIIGREPEPRYLGPTVEANRASAAPRATSSNVEEIAFSMQGKTMYIPVRINGTITIPFILDTGAGDLAIPVDVATTLARAGALETNDLLDTANYSMADGASRRLQRVVIRQVQVGQQTVRDVVATINPATADPLLGQGFLAKFGTVTLDYRRQVVVLSR